VSSVYTLNLTDRHETTKMTVTQKSKRLSRRSTEKIHQKNRRSVTILGVRIDSTTTREVLEKIANTIRENVKLSIVTPNPEIVLQAQTDSHLEQALNTSDIAIADGAGLLWAEKKLYGTKLLHLIKGRELFMDIIEMAESHAWNVILLGDRVGSAQKAKLKLEEKWKKVKLYAIEGANLNLDGNPETNEDFAIEKGAIEEINKIKPHLLFIGFGAPRQEKWMQKWLPKLNCNVIMVVGGTFDYVSGKVSFPPKWWPATMEWLWRLLTQFRFKRIWNAVFVFPYTVFRSSKI
jgi:N-acetylglucosaminyldiphosphoundecaprenol N-acetyl-beta-D-mannosaminyltransferase